MIKKLFIFTIFYSYIAAATCDQKSILEDLSFLNEKQMHYIKPTSYLDGFCTLYTKLTDSKIIYYNPSSKVLIDNAQIFQSQDNMINYLTMQEQSFIDNHLIEQELAKLYKTTPTTKKFLKELLGQSKGFKFNKATNTNKNKDIYLLNIVSSNCNNSLALINYLNKKKIVHYQLTDPKKDGPIDTQFKYIIFPLTLVINKEYELIDAIKGFNENKWNNHIKGQE